MTEQEIKFEDIQKGDIVRTEREFEGGFKITMEGVAEVLRAEGNGDFAWRNKLSCGAAGNHCIASSRMGSAIKQRHILVERKEPLDHIVLALRPTTEVDTAAGFNFPVTKTEAENRAATLNRQYAPNTKYWAVKVPA